MWFEFVAFVWNVVSKDNIIVDPKKIKAIIDWARSTSPLRFTTL